MKIAYFVHDLNDAAVARRVRMMRAGGADVVVLGFRRLDHVPDLIEGAPVVDLGRTADAQMAQRAAAVIRHLVQPGKILAGSRGSTLLIGRNLEALALAARVQRALPRAALVYECLDIHRLLLGRSVPARMIQAAEATLLKRVELAVISSPAFEREYFSKRPTLSTRPLLLENKLLQLDGSAPQPAPAPSGPPWTIAWFGMLRCVKTFETLAALVARHPGRVRVEIAGRASSAVFPDFKAKVAGVPGFRYHGPYRPADLPALYAPCHFAWAIDFFEEGLNSRWLLPNRLYEAASFGVVPLALKSVETGRWLDRHGAGVTLQDEMADLDDLMNDLDGATYAALRDRAESIPRSDVIADRSDCEDLINIFRTIDAGRRA